MCTGTPLDLVFLASAAYSAGTTLAQGSVEQAGRGFQAATAEIDALYEEADARHRAEMIRKAGRRQRGELRAAIGASGVQLGEGSPLVIEQNLMADVENDALAELLTGTRRADAARTEARYYRMAGDQAKRGARYRATGSILSSIGTYAASNWIRSPGAEQAPAPIEERSIYISR